MLKIVIPAGEFFNQDTSEFYYTKEQTLLLEHSLVSISKWESKWKKPFIDQFNEKTTEEIIDYIRCMTITKGVDPLVYRNIPDEALNKILDYISDPMTATTFNDNSAPTREIITSEIIYYWMVKLRIPFECEKWHFRKLLALIKVCALKNNSQENKMSQRQIMESNHALNEMRKKELGTRG